MCAAVTNIVISVSIEPSAADCPVADFVSLAGRGQNGLAKRGDRLHESAEELAIIFASAQNSGIALNGIETPECLIVVLRRGMEVFVGDGRAFKELSSSV